jgi:flagellin
MLRTIRSNVVAAADGSLTGDQRAALQREVDAALQALDRLGANTNFAGQKLLDGSTLEFQLSPDADGAVALVMPEISSGTLGGAAGHLIDLASGGSANLETGDCQQALAILDEAEQQVLAARTQNGAFAKYTLETSSATLDATQINLTSALSEIRDTDVAQAMSNLIRTRILAQSLFNVAKFTSAQRGWVLELLKE